MHRGGVLSHELAEEYKVLGISGTIKYDNNIIENSAKKTDHMSAEYREATDDLRKLSISTSISVHC